MFNIGGGEFLVIALIALIVLGPQRLPDAARQVGRALSELRRLSSGFQTEIRDAFADADAEAQSARTTPRRDVLGTSSAPAPADPEPGAAPATGPTPPRPRRKAPLRAAPASPKGSAARRKAT